MVELARANQDSHILLMTERVVAQILVVGQSGVYNPLPPPSATHVISPLGIDTGRSSLFVLRAER